MRELTEAEKATALETEQTLFKLTAAIDDFLTVIWGQPERDGIDVSVLKEACDEAEKFMSLRSLSAHPAEQLVMVVATLQWIKNDVLKDSISRVTRYTTPEGVN